MHVRTSPLARAAGDDGFVYAGVAVSKTAFGGDEVVTILRRAVSREP